MDKKVLILGIGNILWADEGFGVRAVEKLNEQYEFEDNVRLMDGGTQGLYLIQHVQESDILVVFDAIDYGLAGGTMKLIEDEEVPKFMGVKKLSLHQTGFQDVLYTAELTEQCPKHILLVGVQPVELEDYGGSLRDEVKAQIGPAIMCCLEYLDRFRIKYKQRELELGKNSMINSESISLNNYETLRPSEEEAYRKGDIRFLRGNLNRGDLNNDKV